MEIIAERKRGASKLFVACIVTGVFCLALVVVIGIFYALGQAELEALIAGGIMMTIVGVAFLVTGIVMTKKIGNLPKRILRDGRNIDFDKGLIFTADKIENVTYYEYKTNGTMHRNMGVHRFSYGSLTVTVNGIVLNYEFIANVKQAHNRLVELMMEAENR